MRKEDHIFIPFDRWGKSYDRNCVPRTFLTAERARMAGFNGDDIVEYAPVNEWRDARTDPPINCSHDVIVCYEYGSDRKIGTGYCYTSPDRSMTWYVYDLVKFYDGVTHWQESPELPKNENRT